MQFSVLAAATLLAASVSAYEVLTPTLNSTVAKGKSVKIDWTAVDTDADVFSVYLTNFQTAHWPPTVLSLAQNVPRDDGSITLRVPCDVSSDYGWQINFINGTNTYVIYAQSAPFFLDGDCVEPEPTKAPYPTGYGYSNATSTGTAVYHPTATTALCTSVTPVAYESPVVWFVEPSKEAVCYLPAKETVTVYAQGPAPVTCYSKPPVPTTVVGAYPVSTTVGYVAPTSVAYVTPSPVVVGTGAVYPTKPAFTGAASNVKAGGLIAVAAGAAALLL